MRGLNKVTLIGNLGKDPDVQQLDGNVSVAKFSLATTETFKDRNGQSHTDTERSAVAVAYGCTMAQFGRVGRYIPAERQFGLR